MLRFTSKYQKAIARLNELRTLPQAGQQWAEEGAQAMHDRCHENLTQQGRTRRPSLSVVTHHLYSIRGKPDGSGIRNHLEVRHQHSAAKASSVLGIPQGRPTMVARVQNRGTKIHISDKMRRWFMAHGVFLNASTKFIYIPGRHFWDRALEETKHQQKRKLKRLLKRKS